MRSHTIVSAGLGLALLLGIGAVLHAGNCKKCNHAHDGGMDTLSSEGCDESSDVGNQETTSAITGSCEPYDAENTCTDDAALKNVQVDVFECHERESGNFGWDGTGGTQWINDVSDCKDS